MFRVFWSQGFKMLFMKEDVGTLFEKMLQKTQTLERAHQEGILFKNSENIELKPKFNLYTFQCGEFSIDMINMLFKNQ